jgi:RNA polymerase sigma-B factor
VACVVGELKRHLRDTSWRLHVPRPLQERAMRLCRAADELHQRLGRSPTTIELAEYLEVDEEVGLPRFDGQGWWLGQATWARVSLRVAVSNSWGVM